MPLKLYNTLTRRLETFRPLKGEKIGLYTCGPTVYDEAHIGNLRSYIFADVLRRTLELNGYKVRWVMNITDVDDKTIKRTIDKYGPEATPKELLEYTAGYFSKFKKDLDQINIPAERIEFIRVSDKVKEIKAFIKKLIELGYAYKTDDGVYFSIEKYQEKFGDYGALVGPGFLKGKKVGARVKVDEYEKDNLSDFALWKRRDASDGNIFWSDPELGDGRPGWHIECSVVNREAFGEKPTDIHTGGVDLIFPHHTNEIAQSQPIYKPFVRYWSHCEHLLADNKKMAKRDRNFYNLADLAGSVPLPGLAFRYLMLQSHYRSRVNFTLKSLEGAYAGLERLNKKAGRKREEPVPPTEELIREFKSALNDDLNTPRAVALLSKSKGKYVFTLANILGIISDSPLPGREKPLKTKEMPAEIQVLLVRREEARRNQQFKQADRLRREISRLGYVVEDTPSGPVVRPE